jgi:hypothetical protein
LTVSKPIAGLTYEGNNVRVIKLVVPLAQRQYLAVPPDD